MGQIGEGVDAGDVGPGQAAEHGVVAAAHAHGGGDENGGQNHDKAHDDGDEVGQPRGVAGHLDGGDDQGDDAGADDLPDGEGVEFWLAEDAGLRLRFTDDLDCHGETSL